MSFPRRTSAPTRTRIRAPATRRAQRPSGPCTARTIATRESHGVLEKDGRIVSECSATHRNWGGPAWWVIPLPPISGQRRQGRGSSQWSEHWGHVSVSSSSTCVPQNMGPTAANTHLHPLPLHCTFPGYSYSGRACPRCSVEDVSVQAVRLQLPIPHLIPGDSFSKAPVEACNLRHWQVAVQCPGASSSTRAD